MRKIVVVLCFLIIGIFILFITSGKIDSGDTSEQLINVEIKHKKETQSENKQELRREKMLTKFSVLKELRKKTSIRLNRLSSHLRRTEFPSDQARIISQDMRQASYLLKNPKLLGAFSSPDEIDHEIDQLSHINVTLNAIQQRLDGRKK